MNTRQKQAKASKAKIVSTAFKLFDSEGCGNVSIGDICNAAKISNGAFYHYFTSKDQLIVLWTREPLQKKIEDFIAPKIGKAPTKKLVASLFEILFSWVNDKGVDQSNIYYVASLQLGKIDSYVQNLSYTTLLSIIEKGIEKGELSSNYSAQFYTDYLFSILNGAAIGWNQQAGESMLLSNGIQFIELAYDSIESL